MIDRLARGLVRSGLAAAGVAAFTGLVAAVRAMAAIPNLFVVYLLPVMFAAVTWGWWSALVAAVLSFLAFDFFFVEPVGTFTVSNPDEWVSLVLFLAVAAVTSNLAARERFRREEARRRADEATLLYDLSRTLSGGGSQQALSSLAERLRRAFGLAGVAVLLSQPDGRTTAAASAGEADAADSATQLLGRPGGGRHRHLGRRITIRGRGGERRTTALAVPLHVGERPIGTLRLVGRRTFSDDETRLIATVADQVAAALERERLREEAQQAEILRRTDELRQALLSSVSHDLRTPLASIKASAGSLLQPGVDWSEADRTSFLRTIDRESDRLNRLVANLLDMSRIEGGALRPQADWYDLGELAREVLARLAGQLHGRRVLLEASDELPPIEIDYLMIDQVLTNLIENAARYTPPDRPIEVRIRAEPDRMTTEVVDHGPGIPPGERARVFDKFYRLNPRGKTSGSGLGLAVSRGLIEAHGGRLWADETPGGGATFGFELPLRVPPVAPRVEPPAGPEAEATAATDGAGRSAP